MPDAFCTIIWENKSQVKSCVIIWSFFRDPSKLPNYVLLRQGQPCQSMQQRVPLPSKTVHSRFNGSQKLALQQSDNVAQANKVCFCLDPIISMLIISISVFWKGSKKWDNCQEMQGKSDLWILWDNKYRRTNTKSTSCIFKPRIGQQGKSQHSFFSKGSTAETFVTNMKISLSHIYSICESCNLPITWLEL